MPKVSIIVPVYKTKAYLQKCVDSICAQTYSDFEIILVDDGSPDESGIMCDRLALCDNRISVIHKENGGLSSARLSGFRKAVGEYILFIDSDDYIYPNMLQDLLCSIEEQHAQLSICGYTVVTRNGDKDVLPPWEEKVIQKEEIAETYQLAIIGKICNSKYPNVPGFMWMRLFRRDLIEESYFVSEREVFTEDEIFNLLYSTSIDRIAVVHKPLYYYVQHSESLSNRYRANKWEMLCRRYVLCEEWLQNNNLHTLAIDRLAAAAFSAVCSSLDNAMLLGSYYDFLEHTKCIRNSNFYKQAVKGIKIRNLSTGQKISYVLLRLHRWKIYYKYRKKRMAR